MPDRGEHPLYQIWTKLNRVAPETLPFGEKKKNLKNFQSTRLSLKIHVEFSGGIMVEIWCFHCEARARALVWALRPHSRPLHVTAKINKQTNEYQQVDESIVRTSLISLTDQRLPS